MIKSFPLRFVTTAVFLLLGGAMFRLQAYLSLFLVAISFAMLLSGGNNFLDGIKRRNRIILAMIALIVSLLLLMD